MADYKFIPKSKSDLLLNEWGFDLTDEYLTSITAANFPADNIIFDIATGTGRAASTLARLGYDVITGDYNFENKSESDKRITEEYSNKVKYLKLDMERIPFPDNLINHIVCINTIHELKNPLLCLSEIFRVHSPNGKLLIADFNSEGFDLMDKLHKTRYNKLHPRGKMSSDELKNILANKYSEINEIDTKLNKVFIVKGKRNGK
ncbi:MAG: class I SAM-dependent methyltransferase [bacterium]